jgi:hypothetical protein
MEDAPKGGYSFRVNCTGSDFLPQLTASIDLMTTQQISRHGFRWTVLLISLVMLVPRPANGLPAHSAGV